MSESDTAYAGTRAGAAPHKAGVRRDAKTRAPGFDRQSAGGAGPEAQGIPTPESIVGIIAGYQPLYALASALDLRLFNYIADGNATAAAIEAASGASERGVRRLLNVLAGLNLLTRLREGEVIIYGLTPESAMYLLEGRPGYLGGYVRFAAYRLSQQWRGLTESVRTGQPSTRLDDPDDGEPFWEALVDLLFPWNYPLAGIVGRQLLELQHDQPTRLLDVAAGSGVWGIAAAQAQRAMKVTAFDLPAVLTHARRNAERFGLADRFEFRAGDIRRDDLGEAEYDAAILGQICHSEGREHSRELFKKVARALKPGGTIVVADMLKKEDESGPLFTLMYGLTMLVTTTAGDTFTFSEYDSWLKEAGFGGVRLLEAMGQTVILATRE
jgi:SAM-dependent methyltransferase